MAKLKVQLDDLIKSIKHPSIKPNAEDSKLSAVIIAQEPIPFVAPDLELFDLLGDDIKEAFAVDIVYIQASAAVGKSTLAKYLSATLEIPLLNLANIGVSTETLRGAIVGDFSDTPDALLKFSQGELPIIVDALDEARIFSGDKNLELFLVTAGKFIAESKHKQKSPKLILFGRHEGIKNAKSWMDLGISEVKGALINDITIEVAFFDKNKAIELIHRYAEMALRDSSISIYSRDSRDIGQVIEAYFDAFASALDLTKDNLWSEFSGQAFAGYAPVLDTLGSTLAKIEKYSELMNLKSDLTNLSSSKGVIGAWKVIEKVIDYLLQREKVKFEENSRSRMKSKVPDEAYDQREQLHVLTDLLNNKLEYTSPLNFPNPTDLQVYIENVHVRSREHPFIKTEPNGIIPRNSVFGSYILARSIYEGWVDSQNINIKLYQGLSCLPFIWRSLYSLLSRPSGSTLIDGSYIGYLLTSLWNDPFSTKITPIIKVETRGDGVINIDISMRGEQIKLESYYPIMLFKEIQNIDICLNERNKDGILKITGQASRGANQSFHIKGNSVIRCDELMIEVNDIILDGDKIWIEAEKETHFGSLVIKNQKHPANVGFGEILTNKFPWSTVENSLASPFLPKPDDVIKKLISHCGNNPPIVLTEKSYKIPDDDKSLKWMDDAMKDVFHGVINEMKEFDLFTTSSAKAEGNVKKLFARFKITWQELDKALENKTLGDKNRLFKSVNDLNRFLANVKRIIKRK